MTKSFRHCERGATAVEFAFIGLLLIAGSIAIVDLGRALYLYNKISSAIERAARQSLVSSITDDELTSLILQPFPNAASGTGSDTVDGIPRVAVTTQSEFRLVQVDVSFTLLVPVFVKDKFDMNITRRFPKIS